LAFIVADMPDDFLRQHDLPGDSIFDGWSDEEVIKALQKKVSTRLFLFLRHWLVFCFRVVYIVDCGANIGITSLFLAARYPRARILSVEPHPENFALLKANVAQVPRIVPIRACVTATPQSSVRFTVDEPAWGNRIATDDADGVLVPAITIEELCNQNGLQKIDLLKLDIEGAEEQVFRHGKFLARTEHLIVELHGDYGLQCFQRDIAPYGLVAREARPPDTYLVTACRPL
jgi:FkbM family methyltransferase